jgi:hypothetical protein
MLYLGNDSFGKSYYIGSNRNEAVKLDLFYTDTFIRPIVEKDFLRMASIEEIADRYGSEVVKSFPTVTIRLGHINYDLVPAKEETMFWTTPTLHIPSKSSVSGWQ